MYLLYILLIFSVTAEFKKKSGNTVTDISVGSLSDNATFSVKFSTSVETGSNKCVRLENNAWVDSGSFEATSTTKSSVCLMNHASEFTIVSSTSATIDTKGNFGSKVNNLNLIKYKRYKCRYWLSFFWCYYCEKFFND